MAQTWIAGITTTTTTTIPTTHSTVTDWLGWLTNTLLDIISAAASYRNTRCRLQALKYWSIDIWTHLNHLTRQALTFIKPLLVSCLGGLKSQVHLIPSDKITGCTPGLVSAVSAPGPGWDICLASLRSVLCIHQCQVINNIQQLSIALFSALTWNRYDSNQCTQQT